MLFVNKYFIWALPYLTQLAVLVQNRNSSTDANVFLVICLGDRGLVQQQKEDKRAGKGSLSCLLLISMPCLPTKRGLQPITQPPRVSATHLYNEVLGTSIYIFILCWWKVLEGATMKKGEDQAGQDLAHPRPFEPLPLYFHLKRLWHMISFQKSLVLLLKKVRKPLD